MTDIVQNAMNYRQQLLADISKVDDFLRFGDYLLRLKPVAADAAGTREAAAEAKASAPAETEAPAKAGAFAKPPEAAPAHPAAAAEPAKPAAAAQSEAPHRNLAFRGAFDDPESTPRRNIA